MKTHTATFHATSLRPEWRPLVASRPLHDGPEVTLAGLKPMEGDVA